MQNTKKRIFSVIAAPTPVQITAKSSTATLPGKLPKNRPEYASLNSGTTEEIQFITLVNNRLTGSWRTSRMSKTPRFFISPVKCNAICTTTNKPYSTKAALPKFRSQSSEPT